MNEELVKKIISCKLNAAAAIMEHLPPKVSDEIKQLGRILVDEVNEKLKEEKQQPTQKTKSSKGLESIPIE